MNYAIPRGRISHPVRTEVFDFFRAALSTKENHSVVAQFETKAADYLNAPQALFFPFARTSLMAILEITELPVGSRILMPTITIKPILDVVKHFGLEPILVDVDVLTGCWDLSSLESALEKNPSAALLTYLFGIVPNLVEILPKLSEKNLIMIEDFSQAFGSTHEGKSLGTLGDFSFCSTSSTKTLDTYGGALVLAQNPDFLVKLTEWRNKLTQPKKSTLLKKISKNLIRNLATNKLVFSTLTFPLILLFNAKMNSEVGKFTGKRPQNPIDKIPSIWFEAPLAFQAKVGLRELQLQEMKDQRKIAIAARYMEELKTVGPRGSGSGLSVYWQFIAIQTSAIKFRRYLNSHGIDCATTSLVNLSILKEYDLNIDLPNTKLLYDKGVYLPCYHQLTDKEQARVIRCVRNFNAK